MSDEILDTIPRRHLPHLDALVPAARHHVIARRHETHARNIVIVPQHGPHAVVALLKVPQLDGHVGAARDEQFAGGVKGHVLYRVGVALEGALVLASFKVPHFEGGILARAHHHAEEGVEYYAGHRRPVA